MGADTWVLLLYLGFVPPVQIEGYTSKIECEAAAMDARSGIKSCGLHPCRHYCIKGPRNEQPD